MSERDYRDRNRRRLRRLKRRLEFLESRIERGERSENARNWDIAEASAIRWSVRLAESAISNWPEGVKAIAELEASEK